MSGAQGVNTPRPFLEYPGTATRAPNVNSTFLSLAIRPRVRGLHQ